MSATTVPQPDKLAVRKIRIATVSAISSARPLSESQVLQATRIISKNLSRPVTAAWEQKVIGTCLEEVVDQSDQAFQTAVNIAQSRIQSEQSKIDSARAAIHSAAIHQIEALGKEPKTKSLAIHHWTSVDTDIILAHRDGSRTEEQLIFDLVCFAHVRIAYQRFDQVEEQSFLVFLGGPEQAALVAAAKPREERSETPT